MATSQLQTYDTLLELEDGAAAITADGAGSAIVDVGTGEIQGEVVIDVSALAIDGNDERYDISFQGSTKADFADTFDTLAILPLGALETLDGDVDSTTGRYILRVTNERNGTKYRYVRLYVQVTGTSVSITFTAYLAKA